MHMYNSHGISAKQIPSTKIKSSKSSTSNTRLTKKGIKIEQPNAVIKEKQESIED